MKTVIILAILASCTPAWGQERPCTTQNYSDSKNAPEWACPGPDEGILVPDVPTKPSIGIPAGSSFIKKGGKAENLDYEAILVDRDKIVQLGLRIQGLRRLRWLERHKAMDTVEIEKKYMSDRLLAQIKLEQSRVQVAIQQRDDARKERDSSKRWYRSWTFGLILGVVTTTAATIGIAYAAK